MKSILWFSQVDKEDIPLVGGKGANLGEMTRIGIPVPPGFIVTAPAYFRFLDANQLPDQIKKILQPIDPEDPAQLHLASRRIKKLILKAEIPQSLAQEIIKAYLRLGRLFHRSLVAVRSSATAEDLPDASFAGQQATFLNVQGESNVVQAVRECWASLFEPRAIFYRHQKHFDHFRVGIAVPIQKMVQSRISGVMFTVDPLTANKRVIVVEAIWGLGELIVQGLVTPDHFKIHKQTWAILDKQFSPQNWQLIRQGNQTRKVKVPQSLQRTPKLSDQTAVKIAQLGRQLEQHYLVPQDVEWAIEKEKIYIVQTRPITTLAPRLPSSASERSRQLSTTGLKLLLKGSPASPGLAFGPVRILRSAKEISKLKRGEILVAPMTTPDFVPAMKHALAIVTDQGGQTSHAAIVSRELGITCVVGTKQATRILRNRQIVTVNGQTGEVFSGTPRTIKISTAPQLGDFSRQHLDLKKKPLVTATKLYCNLAEPNRAGQVAALDVDGVGLLRAEFMIAQLGVHPRKLIKDKKSHQFVNHLVEGISTIAQKFSPRPVVYRTTDFKTNEYRSLKGGQAFEPQEENPLLGYRGAYRYLQSPQVFDLEIQAIKKIRNSLNLKNLWLMLPFVRTPEELKAVKKLIAGAGLVRSPSFKLWLMVEIPVNVILLEKFAQVGIDGVSIGSNDLTMLTLGVDRDNSYLAEEFNTLNPAVLWMIEQTIKKAHKLDLTSSICGQAPSLYPQLTEKLINWGVTSISVTPDALSHTRELIAQAEAKLIKKAPVSLSQKTRS